MSDSMQKLREMQARLDAYPPLHELHMSRNAPGVQAPGAEVVPLNERSLYLRMLRDVLVRTRLWMGAESERIADIQAQSALSQKALKTATALVDSLPADVGPRVFLAAMSPGSEETLAMGLSDAEVDVVEKLSAVFAEMYVVRARLQTPPVKPAMAAV